MTQPKNKGAAKMVSKKTTNKTAIAAALVAGLFVLAAALIPVISKRLGKEPDVRIINLAVAATNSRPALDILLWNRSEVAQPITSVSLSLSQKEPPISTGQMAQRIYELEAQLEVFSKESGGVKGSVRPSQSSVAHASVLHAISGSWGFRDQGSWSLTFVVPIQEELPPEKHLSLVLMLPELMGIVKSAQEATPLASALGYYTIGSPPTQFQLLKFLRRMGPFTAIIQATYADSKVALYKAMVTFTDGEIPRHPD